MIEGQQSDYHWIDEAVNWSATVGEQEEAYYLAHWEENEQRFHEWCRENHHDPEDVGSAIAFESHVAAHNEAAFNR